MKRAHQTYRKQIVRTSPSGLHYSIFIAIFIFYYLDFYFLLLYLFFYYVTLRPRNKRPKRIWIMINVNPNALHKQLSKTRILT